MVPGRVARLGPDGPSARLSCGHRPRSLSLVGPAKPDPTRPRGAGGEPPPSGTPHNHAKVCGHGTSRACRTERAERASERRKTPVGRRMRRHQTRGLFRRAHLGRAGMIIKRRPAALNAYVAFVVAAAALAVVPVLRAAGGPSASLSGSRALSQPVFWTVAVFLLLSELWPVRAPIVDGSREEMKTSIAFGFAILLTSGLAPALLAVAAAALVGGLVRRRGPRWTLFELAQYGLSMSVAWVVVAIGTGDRLAARAVPVTTRTLGPILLAGAVLFFVSNLLDGLAMALRRGLQTRRYLSRHVGFQAATAGVLIALAPMAVVASRTTVAVLPLLAFPLFSVYRSASSSLARERDALHDALTGLPNRTLLLDRLEQATARCRRNGGVLAVLIIDLDGFKEVNDTLGHQVGDVLLQRVAIRLQRHVRKLDTVCRLGGDEFAVFLPDLVSLVTARDTASRLLDALGEPFDLESISLGVQASVGIAGFPEHALDTDTLLQRADTAMYLAKSLKTGVEVYSQGKDPSSRRKLALSSELRGAVEENQLVLHYQPKARLSDGEITSVEALVRWMHPWYGMVAPSEFIPLAERTGVMRSLTIKVLEQALRQWRTWTDVGVGLGVAVNISTQNFHDLLLPDEIHQLLTRYRVPARQLEIEITESMLIADPG